MFNRFKVFLVALPVTLALLAGPAAATPAYPIDCQALNADNIGTYADANGYSTGLGAATSGDFSMTSNRTWALPPNGILCIRNFIGYTSSSSLTLNITRNAANTPIILLVEDTFDLGVNTNVAVNGGTFSDYYSVGLTDIGGLGGPGGYDGGSCDFSVTTSKRAGEGLGPGGGKGSLTGGGGGGAGPTLDGSVGYLGLGAGGQARAQFDWRQLRGGSGGGCGADASGTGYAGGGGGGVIIIAAGTAINTGNSTSSQINASGGGTLSGAQGGGGGGGGVIRLIAPVIGGSGILDVRGGFVTGANNCGMSSTYRGGCGGSGLVKLEGYDVGGPFIGSAMSNNGKAAVKFGLPMAPFLTPASTPTATVTNVRATFDGTVVDQVPPVRDWTAKQALKEPGIHIRAGQVLTITVHTEHVPDDATVYVRMNAVDPNPGGGTQNVTVTATSPTGAGTGRDWTATLTVPTDAELGSLEAWIDSVCTPGTSGCDPVE